MKENDLAIKGFLNIFALSDNLLSIDAVMNGWGEPISPEDVTIDELPAPYQEGGEG